MGYVYEALSAVFLFALLAVILLFIAKLIVNSLFKDRSKK